MSLAFGADGELYVALPAAGADGGEGVIARVDVAAAPVMEVSGSLEEAVQAAGCAQAPVATPVA
jgi:hypothetical protein